MGPPPTRLFSGHDRTHAARRRRDRRRRGQCLPDRRARSSRPGARGRDGREALADAGLTIDDVDGVCYGGMPPGIAEYLGIHPRFTDGTMTGGSSYEIHVEHAAAAIAAGLCEVVIGVYAATPRGDRGRRAGRPAGPDARAEPRCSSGRCRTGCGCRWAPTRWPRAGTWPTTARPRSNSRRSPSTPGAGRSMNPRARYREPITIDDVLASPMQASPLHLLDCCLVTDGAGAFVMTSAARAETWRSRPPTCSARRPAPTTR